MTTKPCFLTLLMLVATATSGRADIFRWDDGQVIPGTKGITPGPGVDLSNRESNSRNLRYADFSGDLSGSNFSSSWLDNARFSNANLTGALMYSSTLTNANLSGANLSNASLYSSTLTQADLGGATVTGAVFAYTTGFTKEQLSSTASYQTKNLQRIGLSGNDLTGWDLNGQDFTNTNLSSSTLTQANLSGANLKNANLVDATGLRTAQFSLGSVYNQWTQFPAGFSPVALGLTNSPSSPGDFDANDTLNVADIEMLQQRIRGDLPQNWLPIAMFDVNNDNGVTQSDVTVTAPKRYRWRPPCRLCIANDNGRFA